MRQILAFLVVVWLGHALVVPQANADEEAAKRPDRSLTPQEENPSEPKLPNTPVAGKEHPHSEVQDETQNQVPDLPPEKPQLQNTPPGREEEPHSHPPKEDQRPLTNPLPVVGNQEKVEPNYEPQELGHAEPAGEQNMPQDVEEDQGQKEGPESMQEKQESTDDSSAFKRPSSEQEDSKENGDRIHEPPAHDAEIKALEVQDKKQDNKQDDPTQHGQAESIQDEQVHDPEPIQEEPAQTQEDAAQQDSQPTHEEKLTEPEATEYQPEVKQEEEQETQQEQVIKQEGEPAEKQVHDTQEEPVEFQQPQDTGPQEAEAQQESHPHAQEEGIYHEIREAPVESEKMQQSQQTDETPSKSQEVQSVLDSIQRQDPPPAAEEEQTQLEDNETELLDTEQPVEQVHPEAEQLIEEDKEQLLEEAEQLLEEEAEDTQTVVKVEKEPESDAHQYKEEDNQPMQSSDDSQEEVPEDAQPEAVVIDTQEPVLKEVQEPENIQSKQVVHNMQQEIQHETESIGSETEVTHRSDEVIPETKEDTHQDTRDTQREPEDTQPFVQELVQDTTHKESELQQEEEDTTGLQFKQQDLDLQRMAHQQEESEYIWHEVQQPIDDKQDDPPPTQQEAQQEPELQAEKQQVVGDMQQEILQEPESFGSEIEDTQPKAEEVILETQQEDTYQETDDTQPESENIQSSVQESTQDIIQEEPELQHEQEDDIQSKPQDSDLQQQPMQPDEPESEPQDHQSLSEEIIHEILQEAPESHQEPEYIQHGVQESTESRPDDSLPTQGEAQQEPELQAEKSEEPEGAVEDATQEESQETPQKKEDIPESVQEPEMQESEPEVQHADQGIDDEQSREPEQFYEEIQEETVTEATHKHVEVTTEAIPEYVEVTTEPPPAYVDAIPEHVEVTPEYIQDKEEDMLEIPSKPCVVIVLADGISQRQFKILKNRGAVSSIERLASDGMELTHHLAGGLTDTSSRAALFTGRIPVRYGMSPEGQADVITTLASQTGLPSTEMTFPQILQSHGYSTALIGKWNLGMSCKDIGDLCHHPNEHGFGHFFGMPLVNQYTNPEMSTTEDAMKQPLIISAIAILLCLVLRKFLGTLAVVILAISILAVIGWTWFCLKNPHIWANAIMRNKDIVELPANPDKMAERMVKESIEFLKDARAKGKPFLLVLSWMDIDPKAHNVEELDSGVGEIMQTLNRLGLDDTLVYFTSTANVPNGKLAGIAQVVDPPLVPGIIRWPGVVPAGRTSHTITSQLDILPTLVQLAGHDLSNDRQYDGQSLLPRLRGESDLPRSYFFYCGDSPQAIVHTTDGVNQYVAHQFAAVWDQQSIVPYCRSMNPAHSRPTTDKPDPPTIDDLETSTPVQPGDSDYDDLLKTFARLLEDHKSNLVVSVEDQYTWYQQTWHAHLQPKCASGEYTCTDSDNVLHDDVEF